jgi:hypothetical protein
MKKRHYRAVHKYGTHRHRPAHTARKSEKSYFFIKANICLAMVLCALAAVSVENDRISRGCEAVSELIGSNIEAEDIENGKQSLEAFFTGEKTYAFAGESGEIKLSDEIKAEIAERSGVYEQNNKGAPQ